MVPTQMKPKTEGWNIVIAGHWNRMIFTPEWVGNHLFEAKEIDTLVALLPVLPLVYQDEFVVLEVARPRLVFRPRKTNDDCLKRAEKMAYKVLDLLNNTPIIGVGINIAFLEDAPPDELSDIFNLQDEPQIGASGWDIQERRITRRMVRDSTVLNLSLLHSKNGVSVEFNFHTDANTNELAKKAVDGRAVPLKDSALQMLDEIYHRQLTADGV